MPVIVGVLSFVGVVITLIVGVVGTYAGSRTWLCRYFPRKEFRPYEICLIFVSELLTVSLGLPVYEPPQTTAVPSCLKAT